MRTWYFKADITGDIVAVEPNGTEHFVRSGDMNSLPGRRLLSAMARDLCSPAQVPASGNIVEPQARD